MNVAAILKGKGRAVATARPETLLQAIVEKLTAKRIGAIVIVGANGAVGGIISERDIIRAVAERGAASLQQPVSEFMTRQVVICSEADTLDQLMATMTAGRFRHIPVVEDGALVGIVSIGDVVKHHIAEVEMEASALRTYLLAG
ncbi:MAG: CBS domain-containing protein [Hyphomicrobiaceae bacterium]|nr:CBS domain-containing protein [Hyphomicrobiaceae bacterium]